ATWAEMLTREAYPFNKREYVYASGWTKCTRQMVLEMTHGDLHPAWTAEQLANFGRGTQREVDLLVRLAMVGKQNKPSFSVIQQQERFELKDRKGRILIVGKTDATLNFGGGFK